MFSFFPQVDDSEYAEKDVINLKASQIYSQQGICVCPSRDAASEPFSLSVEVCLQMEQHSHRFFQQVLSCECRWIRRMFGALDQGFLCKSTQSRFGLILRLKIFSLLGWNSRF